MLNTAPSSYSKPGDKDFDIGQNGSLQEIAGAAFGLDPVTKQPLYTLSANMLQDEAIAAAAKNGTLSSAVAQYKTPQLFDDPVMQKKLESVVESRRNAAASANSFVAKAGVPPRVATNPSGVDIVTANANPQMPVVINSVRGAFGIPTGPSGHPLAGTTPVVTSDTKRAYQAKTGLTDDAIDKMNRVLGIDLSSMEDKGAEGRRGKIAESKRKQTQEQTEEALARHFKGSKRKEPGFSIGDTGYAEPAQ